MVEIPPPFTIRVPVPTETQGVFPVIIKFPEMFWFDVCNVGIEAVVMLAFMVSIRPPEIILPAPSAKVIIPDKLLIVYGICDKDDILIYDAIFLNDKTSI